VSLIDMSDIQQMLDSLLDKMPWAEQEIRAAQRRHPQAADRIEQGMPLLCPTFALMDNDRVYRAHCRELLDRLAQGRDTRPGTAAECCLALCEVSQRAPLTSTAAGLYARMWTSAGLPPIELAEAGPHYEALHASTIDEHEAWLRRHLRQDWRILDASTAPAPRRRATG
jgi:hypothetical protein